MDKRAKRLFWKVMSACRLHQEAYLLTLTSSPDSANIRDSWPRFLKRVRKVWPDFEAAGFEEQGGKTGMQHLHVVWTSESFKRWRIMNKCRNKTCFVALLIQFSKWWAEAHKGSWRVYLDKMSSAKDAAFYAVSYQTKEARGRALITQGFCPTFLNETWRACKRAVPDRRGRLRIFEACVDDVRTNRKITDWAVDLRATCATQGQVKLSFAQVVERLELKNYSVMMRKEVRELIESSFMRRILKREVIRVKNRISYAMQYLCEILETENRRYIENKME